MHILPRNVEHIKYSKDIGRTFLTLMVAFLFYSGNTLTHTYRIQSMLMIKEMPSRGSPTDVNTITMVTVPACGMPEAASGIIRICKNELTYDVER